MTDQLEAKFREYEAASDMKLQPDHFIVARIDGRNFHTLCRQILKVRPFDEKISAAMISAASHVMDCGFNTIYGFTQSDEISLLMNLYTERSFSSKLRKYLSILASEATCAFVRSMSPQVDAAFDCRILQIPSYGVLWDYFLWRRRDSERNALNALCYHILIKEGKTPSQAQKVLDGKFSDWKNEFLFQHDINFNNLAASFKRGIGLHWNKVKKNGYNPKAKQSVVVERTVLRVNYDLPRDDHEYISMIRDLVWDAEQEVTLRKRGLKT